MMRPLLRAAILAIAAGAAGASPTFAWQKSGIYAGPKGGMASWTYGCGPYGNACGRTWSATTPGGQTYNGGATVRRTWYGGAVANRWAQGPDGAWYGRRRW